jgi:L-threonylcarbamoyladenylate synthase
MSDIVMTEIAAPTAANLARAVALMRSGEPVAFPTETVYGLGAPADQASTVRRVFELKGRPDDKPLIVHVQGIEQARSVVSHWPAQADALARAFWPGPLTLILPCGHHLAAGVTAGGNTVAVRAPAHPVARGLIAALGTEGCQAIAAPSANPSGQPPPTTAEQVADYFQGRLSLILDGGTTTVKQPSTVLDLSAEGEARILRQGSISAAAISEHVRLA